MIENAAFLIGPWWGSWVCPMNMKIHFTSAVQVPVASRVTLQLKFQRCYLFFWGRGGCDVGRCSGPGIAQPHAASIIPSQSPAQWALDSTTGPCGTTPPTVRSRFPPNPNQSLNSFFLCKFPQSSSSKLLQDF